MMLRLVDLNAAVTTPLEDHNLLGSRHILCSSCLPLFRPWRLRRRSRFRFFKRFPFVITLFFSGLFLVFDLFFLD